MTAATDLTEQFTALATRTQDALSGTVRTWVDTATTTAAGLTSNPPVLPDLTDVVDRCYATAQVVLATHRDVTSTMMAVGSSAATTVWDAARAAGASR